MLDVPKANLTHDVCMAFISRNGSNIRFVPPNIRSDEFDREAVLTNAWAYGYLETKAKNLLLEAINHSQCFDPAMLGEDWAVPIDMLTDDIIAAANAKFGSKEVQRWISKRVTN